MEGYIRIYYRIVMGLFAEINDVVVLQTLEYFNWRPAEEIEQYDYEHHLNSLQGDISNFTGIRKLILCNSPLIYGQLMQRT